jgi:hypothetical protein
LPAVCVVTGAPATSNLRRRFSTTPGWVGCLFFVSWFALLIAIVATRRSASGYLPACNAVAVRVQRRHAVAVRLVVLAVATWIVIIPVSLIPGAVARGKPLGSSTGRRGLGRARRIGCREQLGSGNARYPGACRGGWLRCTLGSAAWCSHQSHSTSLRTSATYAVSPASKLTFEMTFRNPYQDLALPRDRQALLDERRSRQGRAWSFARTEAPLAWWRWPRKRTRYEGSLSSKLDHSQQKGKNRRSRG